MPATGEVATGCGACTMPGDRTLAEDTFTLRADRQTVKVCRDLPHARLTSRRLVVPNIRRHASCRV